MFKTVKSKIIVITLFIFAIFNIAVIVIEANGYDNYKKLKLEACKHRMESFSEKINYSINQLENNVRALSLAGASFYYFEKDKNFLDFIVKDNFENNPLTSVGGGLWFEPYAIGNAQRYCSYASRGANKIILDENCETPEYNYLEQDWYTIVKKNFTPKTKNQVVWSAPYYDQIGTKKLMITAGAAIYDRQEKFIGMASEDWLLESISNDLKRIKPTRNSILTFADQKSDYVIAISSNNKDDNRYIGKAFTELPWYKNTEEEQSYTDYNSKKYVTFLQKFDNGMVLTANIPEDEIFELEKQHILLSIIIRLLGVLAFVLIIYEQLTKNINKPIQILLKAAKRIGKGDFETKIEIDKPQEFAELAQTVNHMTTDIRDHLENIKKLTREKHQIEMDLSIAREIQTSSLPSVFPPFPDVVALDLFADMHTAKQVGGDFYDFYFIDKSHIAFTIADVAGKGIPAALFMMRAKSILKSTSLSNPVIETIMEKVNNTICEHNDKGFFVTVGMGIIDVNTGDVIYINAGHNPPILKRGNDVKFLEVPQNIVVGVFENMRFEAVTFKMEPCDILLMYTDGVTEANDKDNNLYGENRLTDVLTAQISNPREIINAVSDSIMEFSNGAEQADDVTMLCLRYLGTENLIRKINVPAEVSELGEFIGRLESFCDECGVDQSEKSKLLVAAEEIFVNIAYYAYPDTIKEHIQETSVVFRYIKPLREISLTFTDSGVPYNPLEKEDPDITLSAEERQVGGLGIYMVKQMMDSVAYEYKNKQNILTIKLVLKEE